VLAEGFFEDGSEGDEDTRAGRNVNDAVSRASLFLSANIEITKKTSTGLRRQSDTYQEMVLQLHTWGPAFGLPSVEPECIATIAYCQRVLPQGQWALVASYDTTVRATGTITTLLSESGSDAAGREFTGAVR
jgi:hypothetical protein